MRVSTKIRTAMAVLAAVAVGACSDSPTVPQPQARQGLQATTAEVSAARGGSPGPTIAVAQGFADHGAAFDTLTFDIQPSGALVVMGPHILVVPNRSLCDLSSPYGVAYFGDASSCVPATKPVTVTAIWSTRKGRAYIEFSPALRFNPKNGATLYLTDHKAVQNAKNAGTGFIAWRADNGGWIDESTIWPALATHWLPGLIAYRTIWHFSGYNITGGNTCDPTIDPTCLVQ